MNKILSSFILLGFTVATIASQPSEEMGYQMIVNYSPKEYGAYGQNWAVAQNNCGVMYFGNWGGLLEFDGAFWQLYELPNKSSVNSISISTDGKIYVGGINELGYFSSDSLGQLTFHSLVDELPEAKRDFSNVWQAFSEDGKVYFSTNNNIFIWNELTQTFKTIESEEGFHAMLKVGNKIYIRMLGTGLAVIKNDSLHLLPGSEKFATERVFTMLPLPGDDASLMVTRSKGLFKFRQGTFNHFKSEADHFIAENLNYASGTVLSDGNILLGTLRGGAIVIDTSGRMLRRYNLANGIINNNIYHTIQDCSGAIWLATDNGISRIDYASPIEFFDQRNGFTAIPLNTIRYEGTTFVASTSGAYILEASSSDLQHLDPINKQCWSFLKTADNLIIASSDGLYEIEKPELSNPRKIPGYIYSPTVLSISELSQDRIYVGSEDGVFLLSKQRNQWHTLNQILDNLGQKSSVVEDNGTVWVGTVSSGVFKISFNEDNNGSPDIKHPVVNHYDQANGLQNGLISVVKINGEKYFFSVDSIYQFDPQKTSFYSNTSKTIISDFYSISKGKGVIYFQQDSLGRLWLATKGELSMGTQQTDNSYIWISAPFQQFAENEIYHIYPDGKNVTWICTNEGIIKFDFAKLTPDPFEFYTIIRDVSIDLDSIIYYGGFQSPQSISEINFSHNSLKFRYSATSYEGKHLNKFRTFLEGFDSNWSSWNSQTTREYTNLPPGAYTFRVEGLNILGYEGKPATYSFRIIPPWYRTWWAYGVYLLLASLTVIGLDRKRKAQILRKEREQAEFREARLRAQAVEMENKALQVENERKLKELEFSKEIEKAYLDLKATQSQLIQSEKLASLGELTAGIAHEIQNPLNFVNNFSDLSTELIEEALEEMEKGEEEEVKMILNGLKENLSKIHHHGARASGIVKSMLNHSRSGTGKKELVDINSLCDEYLRLAYHGMRAKDNAFQAKYELQLDPDLPKIEAVSQDIGRVLLNLINNAFQACTSTSPSTSGERSRSTVDHPQVLVETERKEKSIEIRICDNGPGIPEELRDKIFQPFFTTKPTGTGTGLGLSLSYDIVKAHGGEIKVKSVQGRGTEFIIKLQLTE